MLEHLTDALVEDILKATDEEILSETEEDAGSAVAEASRVREIMKTAQNLAAKNRLTAARAAVDRQKKDPSLRKVISLNPSQARRALASVLQKHPESTQEFTLAARKGKDLSDSDVLSMLEDLQDLGLYDPEADNEIDK
jgi:choline dehydrogenase-like flavoprotein